MVLQHVVGPTQTGIEVGVWAAHQRAAQPGAAGVGLARCHQTARVIAQPVLHTRVVHPGLHARHQHRYFIGQARIVQATAFAVEAIQTQRVTAPQRVVPLHVGVGASHPGVAAAKVIRAQGRAPRCAGLHIDHQVRASDLLARTQQRPWRHTGQVGEQQGGALHRIEPDHAARLQVGQRAQEHRIFDGTAIAQIDPAPAGLDHLHADHPVLNGLGRDDGAGQRVAGFAVIGGDGFNALGDLGQGQALVLHGGQQRLQGSGVKYGVAFHPQLAHQKRPCVGHGGWVIGAQGGQRRSLWCSPLGLRGWHGLQQAARVGHVVGGNAHQRQRQQQGRGHPCGIRGARQASR